jgi:hypothetical protein
MPLDVIAFDAADLETETVRPEVDGGEQHVVTERRVQRFEGAGRFYGPQRDAAVAAVALGLRRLQGSGTNADDGIASQHAALGGKPRSPFGKWPSCNSFTRCGDATASASSSKHRAAGTNPHSLASG